MYNEIILCKVVVVVNVSLPSSFLMTPCSQVKYYVIRVGAWCVGNGKTVHKFFKFSIIGTYYLLFVRLDIRTHRQISADVYVVI